jgi:hypothetical protein
VDWVVAMSRHSTDRSAWTSTKWLWVFLAFCLIVWRVSSRVEQYQQYRPSVAFMAHQAPMVFFDANERNTAAMDASRSHSRVIAEQIDRLFPVAVEKPLVPPDYRTEWEAPAALPPIYVDSVSLFSNPPPAFLT